MIEPMTAELPAEAVATGPSKILVVDDYLVDRRIAGGSSRNPAACKAIYAENGRAALEMIARESPVAVLTDLQMPEMDGLALVQEIRERFPSLPVILMTAYGSEDVAIQALRAGAANYVPKKALAKELGELTLRQVLSVIGGRPEPAAGPRGAGAPGVLILPRQRPRA